MKVETDLDELQRNVHEYNAAAQRLKLIPRTAKRAGGKQFEIAIDRTAGAAAELCPIEIKARWRRFSHAKYHSCGKMDIKNTFFGLNRALRWK